MMSTGAKPKGPVYLVENTVRRVGTRLHRAKSPTRHRFKLFIAGQRLIRNDKLSLSEAQFKANEKQIHELVLAGKVALHLPDGTKITSTVGGKLIHTNRTGAVQASPEPSVPSTPPAAAPPPPVPVQPEPQAVLEDDLTELPNIGSGRAKKLHNAGITTFDQVADMQPDKLAELLGLTEDAVVEIIEAAKE